MMNDSTDITQTIDQRVRRVVDDVLTDDSLFVVDIVIRGVKGSRVVEIYLDSDTNLGVDMLAKINREIGFLLETEEVIDGRYTLNVSSPGLDRPLKLPRQYKKHVGRPLKVKHKKDDGHSIAKGTLSDSTEEYIELTSPKGETNRILILDIIESKIVLPW